MVIRDISIQLALSIDLLLDQILIHMLIAISPWASMYNVAIV